MSMDLIRIVVIGPESTGKSSLCEALANHFNTDWCPEFAREYLTTHGKDYTFEQLDEIARGQLRLEDEYAQKAIRSWNERHRTPKPLLFIDTDMYVMKVWCEFVFGKCHPWITEEISKRKYDLYLLCNTDLPWQKDHLREYPDLETRETLLGIYRDLLKHQSVPWHEVKGQGQNRIDTAIRAVETHVLNKPLQNGHTPRPSL
jgi:NadR type nicotinamide-nucleotide adenylyltransferase